MRKTFLPPLNSCLGGPAARLVVSGVFTRLSFSFGVFADVWPSLVSSVIVCRDNY